MKELHDAVYNRIVELSEQGDPIGGENEIGRSNFKISAGIEVVT